MEAAIADHETADREELLVHNWRVERLTDSASGGRRPRPALARSMAWRVAAGSGVCSYWLAMKPTAAGGPRSPTRRAGHWQMLTAPDRINTLLDRFLEAIG